MTHHDETAQWLQNDRDQITAKLRTPGLTKAEFDECQERLESNKALEGMSQVLVDNEIEMLFDDLAAEEDRRSRAGRFAGIILGGVLATFMNKLSQSERHLRDN